jgi:predicted HTH transcriptional regulator
VSRTDWLEEPAKAGVGEGEIFDLLDTEAFFKLLNRQYHTTPHGAVDRLLAERLIDEEPGGTFSIRRMGAILLAKDIRAFPDVKRKAARVITYRGTSKIDATVLDRFALRGYASDFRASYASSMSSCRKMRSSRMPCGRK